MIPSKALKTKVDKFLICILLFENIGQNITSVNLNILGLV